MKQPKLLDQVRMEIHRRDYSYRTEQTYIQWIKRFIFFHNKRHPMEMGETEIVAFLSHLAKDRKNSVSTQKQALNALVFLYKRVLKKEVGEFGEYVPAKRKKKVPIVLDRKEVEEVLMNLHGTLRLMASLLYGSGLRLTECLSLRVQDIDFNYCQITVRDGKGFQDRHTILPEGLIPKLRDHLKEVEHFRATDLSEGYGDVFLPRSIDRKYPNASREWPWYWIFPSSKRIVDKETGEFKRWHVHESVLQKGVKCAVRKARLNKPAGCHTFRHCFATHLLEDGYDIRTVQDLLGHKSVKTTMIYTHILNKGGKGVKSPFDQIYMND